MKQYLGDGVYADLEDGMLVLMTENGVETTNRIYLEGEVYAALEEFVRSRSDVTPRACSRRFPMTVLMPTDCDRCGVTLRAWSTSYFDVDVCCMECLDDERLAPTYAEARAAEERQVLARNYRYEGADMTPADREFLAQRRAARKP